MVELRDVIGAFFLTMVFILIIIGTFLKWEFIFDKKLERIFGKEFLTPFNYILGTLGSVFGICGFIVLLIQYLQQK